MENFPSNSQQPKAKTEEKPAEKVIPKVVAGKVTRRKPPLGKRFREIFIGDTDQGVFDFVFGTILVPAMKDMITDAVSAGVERMIFGDAREARRQRPSAGAFGNSNHTNYNRYSSNQRRPDPQPMARRRETHNFDQIIFASWEEANDVLKTMWDIIQKYDAISVKDLYEMVGEEFHYTDEKFGWTRLGNARVQRVSSGYLLNLPAPEDLD